MDLGQFMMAVLLNFLGHILYTFHFYLNFNKELLDIPEETIMYFNILKNIFYMTHALEVQFSIPKFAKKISSWRFLAKNVLVSHRFRKMMFLAEKHRE